MECILVEVYYYAVNNSRNNLEYYRSRYNKIFTKYNLPILTEADYMGEKGYLYNDNREIFFIKHTTEFQTFLGL